MTDTLSPFVFKKVSLEHLEINKTLVLKFRKSTFLDNQYFREEYGLEYMDKGITDPVKLVNILYRFLSKQSKKELAKIKFSELNEETGEEEDAGYSIEKKFLMIFVSTNEGQKELFTLFFQVFGHSQEEIDLFMGNEQKQKKKALKEAKKVIQKKKQ